MQMTGAEMAAATGGTWHGGCPDVVQWIQTDSRDFQQGSVFLALRGEHFDGHAFALNVAERASALVGDSQGISAWTSLSVPVLEVTDTLQAWGDLAHLWRKTCSKTQFFGITGSYGKTTVRTMLVHLLRGLGWRVHSTDANLNNRIGVPWTLLHTPQDADVAVVECGISEQGEMQHLADVLSPDVVVMTGITAAHAEGLGGVQGVVQEKAKLLHALPEHGWCALGDGVAEALRDADEVGVVACEMPVHVAAVLQGTQVRFSLGEVHATLKLPLPAAHWAHNMGLVLSVVASWYAQRGLAEDLPAWVDVLASWQPVSGRLTPLAGIHGSVILDDAYNANPVSMQAALVTLRAMQGRTLAVLGDMKELGEDAEDLHASLDIHGVDQVYVVGAHMQALHRQQPYTQWFATTEKFLAWLETHRCILKPQTTLLVKGSRSMRLDQVVECLRDKEKDYVV